VILSSEIIQNVCMYVCMYVEYDVLYDNVLMIIFCIFDAIPCNLEPNQGKM
jgi:hypothetical protein